jgi:hypothetical protein
MIIKDGEYADIQTSTRPMRLHLFRPVAAGRYLALDKDTPLHRPAQTVERIASVTWLGGLHRHYVCVSSCLWSKRQASRTVRHGLVWRWLRPANEFD